MIIVGSVALFFFIKRQLTLEQAILKFRVFTHATFALATGLGFILSFWVKGEEEKSEKFP